ncbi:MAG: hypothetical protein KatS3mg105_4631 [Gemmatales bacterium]|nr:MAG: hypothetical protein KatS3mg105_4631 [Gemmatales bacterium]
MPLYRFEAMDTSGSEVKDTIEAPNEEEAQLRIKQMGYFVTKISEQSGGKKPQRPRQTGTESQAAKNHDHRRRVEQATMHFYAPVLDTARRRSARPPQLEDSRRPMQTGRAEKLSHRRPSTTSNPAPV